MTEIWELLKESGGIATVLLALSGTLSILYVLTILVLASWPRRRSR